jgi:hypothetical protein
MKSQNHLKRITCSCYAHAQLSYTAVLPKPPGKLMDWYWKCSTPGLLLQPHPISPAIDEGHGVACNPSKSHFQRTAFTTLLSPHCFHHL